MRARALTRALAGLAAPLAIGVLGLAAAFAWLERGADDGDRLVVGSKAHTESILLGEMIAQLAEAHTDLAVERRLGLGGTALCFEALRAGAIDVYPEYTGTALMAILGLPLETDPERALAIVAEQMAARHDLAWLPRLGTFDNTYALAVTAATARELGLARVSDLAQHTGLHFGLTAEFLARPDGWPGLREAYALAPAREPVSMEAGLMYGAVAAGSVDVIGAYATDGRIDKLGLVVLADDRRFFPPYQAAPLLRRATLARHPGLAAALARLDRKITDAEMRAMNARVDAGGATPSPPSTVAREYLERHGLLAPR